MLVLPSTVAELAALGREFSLWQGFSSLCTQQQPPRLGMQNLPWHATVTAWVTATVCCSPALAQQVSASLAQLLRGPEHPVPSPWQHQQQLRAVPQHRSAAGPQSHLPWDASLGRKLCTGSGAFGVSWQLHQGSASFPILQTPLPQANAYPGAYKVVTSQNFWQRGDAGVGRE